MDLFSREDEAAHSRDVPAALLERLSVLNGQIAQDQPVDHAVAVVGIDIVEVLAEHGADLLELEVLLLERVEYLGEGIAYLAGHVGVIVAVEAAGDRILVLVEGEEQHRLVHQQELIHTGGVVGDIQVGDIEQLVDVGIRVDADKAVAVPLLYRDLSGHPRVHLEQHDSVVTLSIAVQAVKVDQLIGIIGVLAALTAVGRRKEDHLAALDGGILIIDAGGGLLAHLGAEVRVHTRHTGGDDLLVEDTELLGEEVVDLFGA